MKRDYQRAIITFGMCAVIGCGGSGGSNPGASGCDSALLKDPSGYWSGVLRKTRDSCLSHGFPEVQSAAHSIDVICAQLEGEDDAALTLIDQAGTTFGEQTYSAIPFQFSFNNAPNGEPRIQIEYPNVEERSADVSIRQDFTEDHCSVFYVGKWKRTRKALY